MDTIKDTKRLSNYFIDRVKDTRNFSDGRVVQQAEPKLAASRPACGNPVVSGQGPHFLKVCAGKVLEHLKLVAVLVGASRMLGGEGLLVLEDEGAKIM